MRRHRRSRFLVGRYHDLSQKCTPLTNRVHVYTTIYTRFMSSNNLHISIKDRSVWMAARTKGEIPKSPSPPRDEGSASAILALGNPLAICIWRRYYFFFFLWVIDIHIYLCTYEDCAFLHQKNFVLCYIADAACAYS